MKLTCNWNDLFLYFPPTESAKILDIWFLISEDMSQLEQPSLFEGIPSSLAFQAGGWDMETHTYHCPGACWASAY